MDKVYNSATGNYHCLDCGRIGCKCNHKASSKYVYILATLAIVLMYGLLGKADVTLEEYEANAKYCQQHITSEAEQACIKKMNNF